MEQYAVISEPLVNEIGLQEPGSTCVFTAEGWEDSDYVDPGDDWSLLPDGSHLSPDGAVRTWPLAGPEPQGT